MGIDIYARWKGQTDDEENAQYTGYSIIHGHVGYLREAYHGDPYATHFLFPEAFQSGDGTARIPASVLRARLEPTLVIVEERQRRIYHSEEEEIDEEKRSFRAFVELCERKERETGETVTIIASY